VSSKLVQQRRREASVTRVWRPKSGTVCKWGGGERSCWDGIAAVIEEEKRGVVSRKYMATELEAWGRQPVRGKRDEVQGSEGVPLKLYGPKYGLNNGGPVTAT